MANAPDSMPATKPAVLPELRGDQVFMRELVEADVTERYVRWMNDPDVTRFLESRLGTNDAESIARFVRGVKSDPDSLMWAICDRISGEHVGNVKLGPVNWAHRFGDIGLIIGERAAWGRGIATEVISLVTDYAFSDLWLHKLTASMYEENTGSKKAFAKAGFALEGIRASQYRLDDHYTGLVIMGRTAGDSH